MPKVTRSQVQEEREPGHSVLQTPSPGLCLCTEPWRTTWELARTRLPFLLLWGWRETGQVLNAALWEFYSRLSRAPACAELAKEGGEKSSEIPNRERWPVIVKFHFLSISS